MTADGQKVLLRYWGSYLKTPQQVEHWIKTAAPAAKRGWRCYLVLERLPENAEWLKALKQGGIDLVCCSRPRGQFDWNCIRFVRALCKRLRPAVFHCENIHTSPMLGAWLARVPVRIWQKHSMFVHFEESRAATWKERLSLSTRLTCALATRVLAVSQAVADDLTGFGIASSRIIVRNNPRTPTNSQVTREQARAAFGFTQADIVIATLGHAMPVKGWDVLLKSFCEVAKTVPTVRLILAGTYTVGASPAFYGKLRDVIAGGQLSGRVIFAGHVMDAAAVLRAADCFVFPSRSEGFGCALIEAMEERLPCVSTKVGIAPEVIQDGVNGLLVERGDVLQMAQALTEITANAALRESFGRNVSVPASIPPLEKYAEQLWHDYESLLARDSCETAGPVRCTA